MERKAVNFQILSSIKSILFMIHNQLVSSPSFDFCTNYNFKILALCDLINKSGVMYLFKFYIFMYRI